MPEWLLGLVSGAAIALFSAWLQDAREARKRGIAVLAQLHVMFEDVNPTPILLFVGSDVERARRNGRDLWRRWRALREPLLVFAFESPASVERAARKAVTHVSLSIQATRNAIEEADDSEAFPDVKKIAEDAYAIAGECVDDLDRAVTGRTWRRILDSERRRTR